MFSAAIEFWVIVQVVVDLLLIILFIIFIRQVKTNRAKRATSGVKPLTQVLEPLLKEAEKVAGQFEAQVLALQQRYGAFVASLPLTDDAAFEKVRRRIRSGTFDYDFEEQQR